MSDSQGQSERGSSEASGSAGREIDGSAVRVDLEQGLGGQSDLDEGPETSGRLEPSVASLRAEILEKVAEYARLRWVPQQYVPGKTPAPYAGRVFDEEEVVGLVDASLDFWLTSGRFCRQLEKELADSSGSRSAGSSTPGRPPIFLPSPP
jgi:hypothetical protein